MLATNPCLPGAYRVSGDLDEFLCGLRLVRQWRLVYTVNTAEDLVLIVFVDSYLPSRNAPADPWDHLYDVCGLLNPERHAKDDCCDPNLKTLAPLPDQYLDRLLEDALPSLRLKHG